MSKMYVCRLPATDRDCIFPSPAPWCASGELPCLYLETIRNPILQQFYTAAYRHYHLAHTLILAYTLISIKPPVALNHTLRTDVYDSLVDRHSVAAVKRHIDKIEAILDTVEKLARESANN